jgi:hypothetical protein
MALFTYLLEALNIERVNPDVVRLEVLNDGFVGKDFNRNRR